jgi:alkaline phosphatase
MESTLRKYLFVLTLFLTELNLVSAQPLNYTVSNAHAHNDYVHPHPFFTAYEAGFGSIEADIFLFHNRLLIGHDSADLAAKRTLESYYLKPLNIKVKKNKGHVFPNPDKKLILLIDIKTTPQETLNKLVHVLKKYPLLINNPMLKVVITGNRPIPSLYTHYPSFIWFDGILSDHYETDALSRIAMMSDNLKKYTPWTPANWNLSAADEKRLELVIAKAHELGKPVRFWNAPDTPTAWERFIRLKADYINTDHIAELAAFLNKN